MPFLKPLKVEKRIKGITAYPRIQLFQGYSFELAGYSAVTGVKPKRRSAEAVTHVYVFCESLQRYVLHDEATYMNNKTAYEPGRTAYARMKKYSSITYHLNLQNCLKKEATLPDWTELTQRV